MEQNIVQKIISMLPAGEKRDALVRKMNAAKRRKENTGGGLHDEFSFKPKGHIMIEEIDKEGKVLGVLADQPNLVVKGSEEILLRAFSGDPKRVLYKNRKIKEYKNSSGSVINGMSKQYNTPQATITTVLNGEDVVPYHQNELWNAVDDNDFDIEYSYYPNTLYVKADTKALEPDMITFRVYDKANAPSGAAPLQAEVYSNYSNLFIGLGDGKNKRIAFNDERLNIIGFTEEDNTLVATSSGSKVEFAAKISNIKIVAKGEGALKVTAGGVDKGTLSLTDNGEQTFEVVGLDAEIQTSVRIEMVTGANVVIKEIAFDEFSIYDNALMGEFENYTLRFDTSTVYNANTEKGPQGTYVIILDQSPVVAESIVVTYDGRNLVAAETLETLESGKFFLEPTVGKVHLAEPLTGVLISYNVTGEVHEDEPAANLTKGTSSVVRKAITKSGDVNLTSKLDGTKVEFPLGFTRIQAPEEVVVELDGVTQTYGTHYTIDAETGKITLIPTVIPAKEAIPGREAVLAEDGETVLEEAVPEVLAVPEKIIIPKNGINTLIVRSFDYEKHTSTSINNYKMTLKYEVKDGDIRVLDHKGNELKKVETEAEMLEGCFIIRATSAGVIKELLTARDNNNLETITKLEVYYKAAQMPGVPTNYTRQVIEKPKAKNEYPWFQLDKGKLVFVAEFPENSPGHNVTIREMGLFDGPRVDDSIRGFTNYNVKAFSLVRVGETRKEATTGLRVTWTITLLNEDGQPFKGGL